MGQNNFRSFFFSFIILLSELRGMDKESTRENINSKDELMVTSKNYKQMTHLVRIDSIKMLTEQIDPCNDIKGIKESLINNSFIEKATYNVLELLKKSDLVFFSQINLDL